MKNIFKVDELDYLKNLLKDKKTVLVGGCFDVIHLGHIIFLEKAKKAGDILIVLLESDEKVKFLKGNGRPMHDQVERAKVLLALRFVDFIVLLPFITQEKEYSKVIFSLKPSIIAATKNSPDNLFKLKASKLVGAQLKMVTEQIAKYSTTRILHQSNSKNSP